MNPTEVLDAVAEEKGYEDGFNMVIQIYRAGELKSAELIKVIHEAMRRYADQDKTSPSWVSDEEIKNKLTYKDDAGHVYTNHERALIKKGMEAMRSLIFKEGKEKDDKI